VPASAKSTQGPACVAWTAGGTSLRPAVLLHLILATLPARANVRDNR